VTMFSQASSSKSHRASKVLFIGGLKMLLSTGSSPWNHRQIVLWDPVRLPEERHVLTQIDFYRAGGGDGRV